MSSVYSKSKKKWSCLELDVMKSMDEVKSLLLHYICEGSLKGFMLLCKACSASICTEKSISIAHLGKDPV